MPRKSNDEMIADLEAKLAKARENAITRVQSNVEKLKAKRALLEERLDKINAQIKGVDLEIAKLEGETVQTQDEV